MYSVKISILLSLSVSPLLISYSCIVLIASLSYDTVVWFKETELNVIGGGTGKMIEMCRVRHLLVVVYLVRFWSLIYFS